MLDEIISTNVRISGRFAHTNSIIVSTTAFFLVLVFQQVAQAQSDVYNDLRELEIAEQEIQELTLERITLEQVAKRRAKYEAWGKVPETPPELTQIIPHEDLQFGGYANAANNHEIEEAALKRSDERPDEEREESDTSTNPNDFGIFVNSSGEIWHWRPKNPDATRKQLEGSNLDIIAKQSSPPSERAAASDHEERWEADDEFKTDLGFDTSVLFSVFGTDTREIRSKAVGHSLTSYPLHTIGALNPDGTASTNPNSGCTATKIGPRHLLTAGHCVNVGDQGSNAGWIWRDWWPGQDGVDNYENGGDSSPNGIKNIKWYWVHSNWLNDGTKSKDYAVLILYDNSSSCNFGWLGYQVDNSLAATSHWNFGFPSWQYQCSASPVTSNWCWQSMYGSKRNIVRTTSSYAYYYHDTQGGHSGGPVYQVKNGDRYIHAIHRGHYSSVENYGVKIKSAVFDNIFAVKQAWPSTVCP